MAKKTVRPTLTAMRELSVSDGRGVFKVDGIPYLFVRVTPTAKTWFYQRTVAGRQKRHTLGKFPGLSIPDAKKAAEALSARYALGEDVAETERQQRAVWTVEQAWQAYRADHVRNGGKSAKTLDSYWSVWLKPWRARQLDEVTKGMAESLQDRVLEKRSNATANRVIATGKALFNFAKGKDASGFDGDNPFERLKMARERSRTQRMFRHQIPKFFAALESLTPQMRDFMRLAVFTGRRAGDLRAMRWVDVDLDARQWLIPDTKAGEPQVVALAPEAVEVLAERRKRVKGPWVFPANSKSGHMAKAGYRKAWAKVRKLAGLGEMRFHDLRRSIASIAFEMGASKQVVGDMLGHRDQSTTERIYTRISNEAQRALAEQSARAWTEAADG